MRVFERRDLHAAIAYAEGGGQAIHLHRFVTPSAPAVFKAAVKKGEYIAHLFDQDKERLTTTVRGLGVRVVKVEREGTPYQHVDLCGLPLARAVAQAENIP
jgi:hypothetical protein